MNKCGLHKKMILNNRQLAIEHYHFVEISSTQTYAQKLKLNLNRWILVSADKQTEGKGQMNRTWKSNNSGNIYATLLIPVNKRYFHANLNNVSVIPQIIAVAIISVLINKRFEAKLKWINDIFINNKKVCGILCELGSSNILGWQKLLIGFGMNVNASQEELINIDQPATSLLLESGTILNEAKLLEEIVASIYVNLNLFMINGFKYFLTKIINFNLLQYQGKIVNLEVNPNINNSEPEMISGKLMGLSNDGGIILALTDGGKQKVFTCGSLTIK